MADMGRGRSRGRAGPKKTEGPARPLVGTQRGAVPAAAQPPTQPPLQGAWARSRGELLRPGPSAAPPRPQLPAATGRASHRQAAGAAGEAAGGVPVQQPPPQPAPGAGGRGDAAAAPAAPAGGAPHPAAPGRGAMRGRRQIGMEILNTRPKTCVTKKGTSGRPIKVQANYFKLLSMTDWCLYQYRVDFSPSEDRTAARKGLLKVHKNTLGSYIFDGTVLYTVARLYEAPLEYMELFSQRESDSTNIRITIKLVGDMVKGDHHYLQFFNIIMRKCLGHLNLKLVGRNFFDACARIEVPNYKFELWPGYLTSIRQHEYDILMCSEITHKIMRQQTLLDILTDCYNRNRSDFQRIFKAEVIGLVVLTDYNNNTYRIDDVDFDSNPLSTFELRNGEHITYRDYYQNKYQKTVRNPSQPLLVTRTKARERRAGEPELIYLVPELCRATGLTDDMRANFRLMQELANYTRVSPEIRIQKLTRFNSRLLGEPKVVKEFQDWNLKLDRNLVEVPARVMVPEQIFFGFNRSVSAGTGADWTKALRDMNLLVTKGLADWVMICPDRVRREAQNFVSMIIRAGAGMNFVVREPRYFEVRDDRANTYTDAIETVLSKANPELVFCIVQNNRADRYSAIKKKCLVDRPVPTQVLLQKTLGNKSLMSVATKVAIQLNCKLGGAAWGVDVPVSNLMVIGFDVCHDTNTKNQDIGAMVASLDKQMTRYFSAVSFHTNGEELSNDLANNVCKALHKYKEMNKCFPKQILIYRDGVGEGQVPYVFQHEVTNIRKKLEVIYGDPNLVKMAFIIVTKRINTRFFMGRENPSPGTVIDDIVTDPLKYDFFIVSQFVKQGTVTPTAYNVLYDTSGFNVDKIQRMTFKLTHMYFNWSGTVRVPAPCQYAHKLAFLIAQFVHRPPSNRMDSLLYFL